MASRYLLDTNHLSAAVKPGSIVRQRIREHHEKGARIGSCVPVLCELEVGARQVKDPELYRKILARFLTRIPLWPLDEQTARIYADIYHDLKGRGRVLSQVDIMSAALARQMNLTVLTTDRDFDYLEWLRKEDWTTP